MTDLQQTATKEIGFTPSLQQVKWLETALQFKTESVTQISEESGIDRTNWYRWIKDENFRKWFMDEWDKVLKINGWYLDMIGLNKAKNDFDYWKSMQQRVGRLLDKPSSLTQVNFGSDLGIKVTEYVGDSTT